jgi:hypothetical protein
MTYIINPSSTAARASIIVISVGVLRNFFRGGEGLTNSVEDRGKTKWGCGGGSPLGRGSAQFANE